MFPGWANDSVSELNFRKDSPLGYSAKPFPSTSTKTSNTPTTDSPTEHEIDVSLEDVTSHTTSLMVTLFSTELALNPEPVRVMMVLLVAEPCDLRESKH